MLNSRISVILRSITPRHLYFPQRESDRPAGGRGGTCCRQRVLFADRLFILRLLHQEDHLLTGAVNSFDQDAFDVGRLRGSADPNDIRIRRHSD